MSHPARGIGGRDVSELRAFDGLPGQAGESASELAFGLESRSIARLSGASPMANFTAEAYADMPLQASVPR